MSNFLNISNWTIRIYDKPQKGSRPNDVIENPENGELFYFKQSKLNYPSEVWSEVIASKLGQILGFNVLDYNIAYDGNTLGCISKSMINKLQGEILIHGVDLLSMHIKGFIVTDKPINSFQDLVSLCRANQYYLGFEKYFIELIIFDAIVGNTDRHTENWGFIIDRTEKKVKFNFVNSAKELWWFVTNSLDDIYNFKEIKSPVIRKHNITRCSPIYDSGSCLGRDIGMVDGVEDVAKIEDYLKNPEKIARYIKKAKSEIRWHDKKLSLFEIVTALKNEFPKTTNSILSTVFKNYTDDKISSLIDTIDLEVSNVVEDTHLSKQRKALIKEIIKQRIIFLKNETTSD